MGSFRIGIAGGRGLPAGIHDYIIGEFPSLVETPFQRSQRPVGAGAAFISTANRNTTEAVITGAHKVVSENKIVDDSRRSDNNTKNARPNRKSGVVFDSDFMRPA